MVNALFSRSTAAGGAVVDLSTKPCQLDIVWKIHQSLWKNIEIRPKTNDVTDGKTTHIPDLVHFSVGNIFFSMQNQLFPKETGEILDTIYSQPLDTR